jgi:DNA invertase Pin-like site-specific DNA recombinase
MLESLVNRIPITGKPRPRPFVRGAFIIVRLSKPKEKMSSLTMQERKCREYIERELNIPVLDVFQDIKSGLLPQRREGYQEAMRRARMGLCSHIVIYDFDRFSRERVTSLKDYADLEVRGIELHDVLNGYIDYETAGQKAVQSENEARKTGRRVYDNMMERHMNKEEYESPRRPPWGYCRNHKTGQREADPDTGHIVTELFERYGKGEGEASLRLWFNEVTGRNVRIETIHRMLRNEYYCGIDLYNKKSRSKIRGSYTKSRDEWCTRTHDHPLIDPETFQRVQARLDSRKTQGQRRLAAPQYALRGLVVCASCGARCRGHTDPKKYHVALVCSLCWRSRTYGRVEQRVQDMLAGIPLPVAQIEGRQHATGDLVGQVEAITARIEKVRARRGRLINKREDGEISDPDYHAAMAETDRELDELTQERERIVHGAQEAVSADEVLNELSTISHWSELLDMEQTTVEQRNRVYQRCCKQIHLDYEANTVTVVWSPALERLAGRSSDTLPLKPAKPKTSKALNIPKQVVCRDVRLMAALRDKAYAELAQRAAQGDPDAVEMLAFSGLLAGD